MRALMAVYDAVRCELCEISPGNTLSVLDGDGGAARELSRVEARVGAARRDELDRKSTRLNSVTR